MMKRTFLLFLTAISIALFINMPVKGQSFNEGTIKIGRTLGLIDAYYVDTTNLDRLTEKVIVELLKGLDPHSTYISAKDVKEMNEPLTGNFDGIGVQFNILRDSIIIIEPISGGPSEKIGIRAGDRIVTINKERVAGIGISNTGVRSRLMGPKGTSVIVTIFRRGERDLLEFNIIRDKIPINSLDAAYMLDKETGYIKLNKFAATTENEFSDAVLTLQKSNMKHLVLDLRGNGGGYMLAATALAEKFFSDQRLLVYVEGRKQPRQDYKSSGAGKLSGSRVVVLTDEGSASASEILAGALQDWDRGVIMGRRTFGKGLVQNGFYLTDGSMIRLTIARYYTPAGRSIQSPYAEGYDKYYENFLKRYTDGELISADSIHFPDSLKSKTLVNKRIVYSGGGLMPDVFMGVDTTYNSDYFRRLVAKNVLNTFALDYYDKNRSHINSSYKSFDLFNTNFSFKDEEVKAFIAKGEADGVKFDQDGFTRSKDEILLVLKGLIATNIWQTSEYFQIVNQSDDVIRDALKLISDKQKYDKILGYQ